MTPAMKNEREIGDKIQRAEIYLIRYELVLVLAWIGAMKFTEYEANAIKPLVDSSPLMSWVYQAFTVRKFAAVLGTYEIIVALLIALRPIASKVSAIGRGLAALMFLGTLSFVFSMPGWEPSLGGFPSLSVVPGQFLLKDIVLFGVAVWSMGEALKD